MERDVAVRSLSINLEYGDSPHRTCSVSPVDRYARFVAPDLERPGRGRLTHGVSVLVIPDDIERDWWGAPGSAYLRRRVRRALRLGYEFREFDFRDYRDDIYEINLSKPERQGKPMSAAYTEYPPDKAPFRGQTCPRHRNDYVGVFQGGRLFAYALLRQCGEMVLFSEILGHGERLDDGIMYLLVFESVKLRKKESGARYAVYHLHDAGSGGLRYFKEQAGFAPFDVHWELGRPGVPVPTFAFDPDNPEVLRVVSTPPPVVPPGMTFPSRDEVWANRSAERAFPSELLQGAGSAISFFSAAFFGRNDVTYLDRLGIPDITLVDVDGPKVAAMAQIYSTVTQVHAEDAFAVAQRLRQDGARYDVVVCDPFTDMGFPIIADHFEDFSALARRVLVTGIRTADLEQAGVEPTIAGVQDWFTARGHGEWEVAWLRMRNSSTGLQWLALRRRNPLP